MNKAHNRLAKIVIHIIKETNKNTVINTSFPIKYTTVQKVLVATAAIFSWCLIRSMTSRVRNSQKLLSASLKAAALKKTTELDLLRTLKHPRQQAISTLSALHYEMCF